MFPQDYQLIGDESTILNNLQNYIGRHIIYSVTPINKVGKFGKEEESQPVYIMGPPVYNTNLKFHLDPYTLRNTSNVFIADNSDVQNWRDYSISQNFTPAYSYANKMKLSYIDTDAKTLILNNTQAEFSYDPTNNNNYTVFIVYRNTSVESSKSQNIVKRRNSSNNNGWELRLNGGKIEFFVQNNASTSKTVTQSVNAAGNDKYIISGIVSNSNIKLVLDKNDSREELNSPFTYSINTTGVKTTLGGASCEENIYEIIIYNSALSEQNVNSVREYLAKKHRIQLQQ